MKNRHPSLVRALVDFDAERAELAALRRENAALITDRDSWRRSARRWRSLATLCGLELDEEREHPHRPTVFDK